MQCHILFKVVTGILAIVFIQFKIYAQSLNPKITWDSLTKIETSQELSTQKKLQQFYNLKNQLLQRNQDHDSIYARILLKIGFYEYQLHKNYQAAIEYSNAAIKANTSNKKNSSLFLSAKAYFNLAKYYEFLGIFNKALNCYDTAITSATKFPDTTNFIIDSKFSKVFIHFLQGDYQKAIDESINGMHYSLQKNDSSYFLAFLNQKAQSLYFENQLLKALFDVETVIIKAQKQEIFFELASALKMKAMILKKMKKFSEANTLFSEAIKTRIKTENFYQISLDYIDYGNFLLDSLHNYQEAKNKYLTAIEYAKKNNDSIGIALATINIGEIYLEKKMYLQANEYCIKAFGYLNMLVSNNITSNPPSDKLMAVSLKQLPIVIMNNKIEVLLGYFYKFKNQNALKGCLQTCLVMDTLVTKLKNLQIGTESKLYWRNYTRQFYTNAIEASYLANRPDLAFFFMEKSRAVLLNDKLNELDASSFLSAADAAKQEFYEIRIIELEQMLSSLSSISKQFQTIQLQRINVKNEFDQFIKSLDQKYPAYYQYKYDDEVPSLNDLQKSLAKNKQSFVHYFLGDTVTYILAVTSSGTTFKRLSQNEFDKDKLTQFLRFCANKQALNNNYDAFVQLSHSIYTSIFQPLHLPAGRTIICADNIVIPFDALHTDAAGKRFLLNDYTFSYVYSARFFMKRFKSITAKGNFAGFAPVSFDSSLKVADLKNAANALEASAAYYKTDKLFTHKNASRRNFFNYASSYSIISIFSHARADTTDNEPVLFMQDSVIHLSELQLLNHPATKLALLSACQTNVGKAATGEGIFSLARGFAAAGIPSVAATLWKADEQTIYTISEKFNQLLAEGMNKDEALQKAKLYFIENNSFPYYWANMILIGNTDAINLATASNNYWWWIGACIFTISIILVIWKNNFFNIQKIKK